MSEVVCVREKENERAREGERENKNEKSEARKVHYFG